MKNTKAFDKKIKKIANSNQITLLCSFLLAVSAWFWVSTEKSPTESIVISNVPVVIDYSDSKIESLDLQVFGDSSYTVDVTVTGKWFAINKLTANDLIAAASAKDVESAGTKILPITVTTKNKNSNYKISNVSKNNIDVYFDTLEVREYDLITDVIVTDGVLQDGYKLGSPILSSQTVSISGPTSKLDKISNVKAIVNIGNKITESINTGVELSIESDDKDIFNYVSFEKTNEDITVLIPLLREIELPITVTYTNLYDGISEKDIETKINPSSTRVFIKVEEMNNINSIVIGNIDCSTLKRGVNIIDINSKDLDYDFTNKTEKFRVTIKYPN